MKFNQRNVYISPKAKIGVNVKIGDNTSIYDHVEIGDDSIICNDCQIGEPLPAYYSKDDYENPVTKIGANALIRSHATIYAGNTIGDHLITGHYIMLRAKNVLGHHNSIGNFTEIHGFATLGNFVRLHSNACICEHAIVHDFVWVSPGVILTNDKTPPTNQLAAPEIGAYTLLAANSIVLPGIKIGEHCLVGASSVVTRDVKDYSVVKGNPARFSSDIRTLTSPLTGQKHYPWPKHFDRGMPWQGQDYEQWLNNQSKI
jgi:acetyltransferase-like isoleucine patch superfamily enzyme